MERIRDKKGKFDFGLQIFIICPNCGETKKIKPAHIGRSVYCSKKCYFIGKIGTKQTPEHVEKRAKKASGKKRSIEFKKFLSKLYSGNGNPSWRGGVTPERVKERNSHKYKEWRKAVFERDNYTCLECGSRGGKINADHIKPWWLDKNNRYSLENGQTLCEKCHIEKTRKEHSLSWVNQFKISDYRKKILGE